jgi:hypothetical protein
MLTPFYSCGYECEAQALYRVSNVFKPIYVQERELTGQWMTKREVKNLTMKEKRRGGGHVLVRMADRSDGWVLATPALLPHGTVLSTTGAVFDIITRCYPLTIKRIYKSQRWASDDPEWRPITIGDTNDLRKVVTVLKARGVNVLGGRGRIPYAMSDDELEYVSQSALQSTTSGWGNLGSNRREI